MPIANETYSSLTQKIADTLVDLCQNTTTAKYNAIDACFKTYNVTLYEDSKPSKAGGSIVETLKSTPVTNQNGVNLKSKIEAFLGADYTPSENISMPKFISYFNSICQFCAKNIGYTTSQHSTKTYLIYKENGFESNDHTFPPMPDDVIYAASVTNDSTSSSTGGILYVLRDRINRASRCVPVQYQFTLSP